MNHYFNKKIGDRIHKEFEKNANVKYKLDFDTPTLSLFDMSIQFTNINLTPLKTHSDSAKAMYSLVVNDLKVSGLDFFDLYFRKDLNADNIKLSGLIVMVYQGIPIKDEKVINNKKKSESGFSSSYGINSVRFRSIQIDNAQLKIFHNHNDRSEIFSSTENTVNIVNFSIDSVSRSSGRLFNADVFDISMNRLSYRFPNGLYTLRGKQLVTSYYDSVLKIDSVELIPNFSKEKFGEIVGHQISRTKVGFSQLIFSDLDIRSFIENNVFISNKLIMEGLSINVFRDKNIPFKNIVRPSLQQIVRSMPFEISIDTVKVNNGRIVYEELSKGGSETEKVSFSNFNILMSGLNNDTTAYADTTILKIACSAMFLNSSRMEITCVFPLNTKEEKFYCSGILSDLQLNTLDKLLEKAHVAVEGQLDSLKFSFYADDVRSKGSLRFIYHDLKLTLLSKEDNVPNLKEKISSILLEKFFIKESNPGKDRVVRVTRIHFNRDPYRFFIFYIWKSIQSGIAPAIGLPESGRRM